MPNYLKIAAFLFCLLFLKPVYAQDIRAGWINYSWISGYTYSISTTLVLDSATAQTHTDLTVYFGDGDSCISSITSSTTNNQLIFYKYACTHTYSGPGVYTIYFKDKYRIAGINNISNSQNADMVVFSKLAIDQFFPVDNSPFTTNEPVVSVPAGTFLKYNPAMSDPDGDSLSYTLVNCGFSTPTSYYIPATATLDASTGNFFYEPDTIGFYAFKIQVKEWRKDTSGAYQFIGDVELDFTVQVTAPEGINELKKNETISLYPNPASDILNINASHKNLKTIEVMNALGEIISKKVFSNSIDISLLPQGYYTIKFSGDQILYSKFIKE